MEALQLIDCIRSSDDTRRAQEELYLRVRELLLARLHGRIPDRLRSRLDADDVLHQAFLRAMKALDGFEGNSDRYFYGWVYTIAKNLIIDAGRRPTTFALSLTGGDDKAGPRESQIPSGRRRATSEFRRREWLETMLANLKEKEAEVIRRRVLQGLSFQEIAARSSKTSSAARRFYSRALNRLREVAQRHVS